jgi:hypothetical protein
MGRQSILSSDEGLADGLARIEEGLREKPLCDTVPKTLRVREVRPIISVFQPRALEGRILDSEAHVRSLMACMGTAEKPVALEPITVWWAGSLGWVCLDGHHRLEAHHRLGHRAFAIPVTVFEGTLDEARAEATATNSRDKLAMRDDDKFDRAWSFVLTSGLSKARIVDACNVSDRTVGMMRAKLKAVLARAEELRGELGEEVQVDRFDLAATAWKQASRSTPDELLGLGQAYGEDREAEDYVGKMADRMVKLMVRPLGPTIMKNTDAFALALERIDSRLPSMLLDEWGDHFDDEADGLLEEISA